MTKENERAKMKKIILDESGLLGLKEISHLVKTKTKRKEDSKRDLRQNEKNAAPRISDSHTE